MKTKLLKTKLFIAVIFLVSNLVTGAAAQSPSDSEPTVPPHTGQSVELKLRGIEISDGFVGFDNFTGRETMFGYAFVGQTYGALPGVLTLSMNCTPAAFTPGGVNEVTGGTWTLPIYSTPSLVKQPVYLGSFYGHIATGKMGWETTSAQMNLIFTIDGGTLKFTGATGEGTFEGTFAEPVKGEEEATIEGVFRLKYAL
jgi:hypothetical protein